LFERISTFIGSTAQGCSRSTPASVSRGVGSSAVPSYSKVSKTGGDVRRAILATSETTLKARLAKATTLFVLATEVYPGAHNQSKSNLYQVRKVHDVWTHSCPVKFKNLRHISRDTNPSSHRFVAMRVSDACMSRY